MTVADRPGDAWEWDPTLFAGAAPHYEVGRLPYAPGVPAALADALGLDGSQRLLDVGCGPGTVARLMAPFVAEAIGLDADADMLAEAARLAASQGIANATWVHARGEELPLDLGQVDVVTFAASLHWMDRALVFSRVRDMLRPGGAVVHVDHPGYREVGVGDAALPHPVPPTPGIREICHRHLGPRRRAGRGYIDQFPGDEDDVFRSVGFAGPQTVVVPDGRVLERTADQVVANAFSSSNMAPHLFPDGGAAFEAEVRALLAEVSPTGRFAVRQPDNLLKIWRPVS